MQFRISETSGESPLVWYQSALNASNLVADAAQSAAILVLNQLWQQLIEFKHKRNQFLGRSLLSPNVPHGIYLWGGVGRGKTLLMDAFFNAVPYKRKRRVHFHRFMSDVHHAMKRFSEQDDPLIAVAEQITRDTRLLCLDEFHVDDIADAMILARLLTALFQRGLILVTTSNAAPDHLYPNGLQRQHFLPAIALLKQHLQIIHVDGKHDYRLRALRAAELYFVSDNPQLNDEQMQHLFAKMCAGDALAYGQTERGIPARWLARNVVWLEFDAVCGGCFAQEDFLVLANQFSIVFLSNVPFLSDECAAEARRLTWLIDVLYDHHVRLVASFLVPLQQIATPNLLQGELSRTVSRLIEMQSAAYVEL